MSSKQEQCSSAPAARLNLPPQEPASRHTNPFATCWTRPGALPFLFAADVTAEGLLARLAARDWQGAVIGPHGSGKSTLLAALLPLIEAAGRRVFAVTLLDGQRRLPRTLWQQLAQASGRTESRPVLVIVDGYEQLGWLERARLKRHCRRTLSGLLVTTHEPIGLPTLIELDPDVQQIQALVHVLCARTATPIPSADVAASHARHGRNVREIFFDLYDRHEQLRRAGLMSQVDETSNQENAVQ